MEWAAAVEVTSGILSFITFSVEAFKMAPAAKMAEHRDKREEGGGPVSENVEAIMQIAIDSEKHCAKLLELLAALTFTPTEGESSAEKLAKNAKTVIKNIMKKGEVKDLEAAIDKNRSATLLHLQLLLEERQVSIQIELSGLRSQSWTQSESIAKHIETLGTNVLELATQLTAQAAVASTVTATAEQDISQVLDNQLQMAKSMQRSLGALLAKNATPSPEVRILRGLFFDELYERKYGVRDAKEATFEWILDEDKELEEHDGIESDSDKWMRSYAQSSLLTWLRSGNEVFHISGKAGSGKSTLMKLLVDHPRTRSELKLWSGKRHLISAQFFFWRSGTKLQKSLTANVLSSSAPVFPSAYGHFGRDDNCVEQVYFQPKSIEAAFNTLIHSTLPSQYCLCLFVDGLDEYVGDDDGAEEYGEDGKDHEAHQKLADELREWASSDRIKIVASSRPHMEFNNTFSKDQQIHLHNITRRDIFLYGLNTIKRSRNFGGIEQYHRDLCLRVVDNADGVFLWAEFAVRVLVKLIASHATVGPLETKLKDMLDKKLRDMPKSLSKLYKSMLGSLLDSDRQSALKILRFVHKCPYRARAVYFSWLDEWGYPNFPQSTGDPREYDGVETRKRLADVDYKLDDLTRGLLHTTLHPAYTNPEEPIYFTRSVQVYHRTVYDFIGKSPEMRDEIEEVDRQFPFIANSDLLVRLQLAELWFAPRNFLPARRSLQPLLGIAHMDTKVSNKLLSLFRRALDHHRDSGGQRIYGETWQQLLGKSIWALGGDETVSVDHWAMFASQEPLALVADAERIQYQGGRRADDDNIEQGSCPDSQSLLLSAALAGSWTVVRALLQLGHSPEQMVLICNNRDVDSYWSATVWMVYYTMLAMSLQGKREIQGETLLREISV